jgi:hypothetical protein
VVRRCGDDLVSIAAVGSIEDGGGVSSEKQAAVGSLLGEKLEGQAGGGIVSRLEAEAFCQSLQGLRLAAVVGQLQGEKKIYIGLTWYLGLAAFVGRRRKRCTEGSRLRWRNTLRGRHASDREHFSES